MALGACVAVMLLGLGLLMASGAKGNQLGIAAALFGLVPPITYGGAMIVTSRNLDAKGLGLLAFIFLGVVPMVPLLGGWGYCGFKMSGARCLGNTANGALWTIALVCPGAALCWGFIHRVLHGDKTGPRVSIAIATAMCVLVMLPLGAFLPVAALDVWVSWDYFWKGDAMYAACMISFTTIHAISYRLLYASFLLEHYDPLSENTPSEDEQIKQAVEAGEGGQSILDAAVLVDPKEAAKKRRDRTRFIYQLSFVGLFVANAVLTQSVLSMLNARNDIGMDIGKRNMLIVVSIFSVFVVPISVFIIRADSVSLSTRLTSAIWFGMVLPQFGGFSLGTYDQGDQEALRAFLLRVAPTFTLLLCTYATLLAFVKREVLLYYGGMTNFWIVAFCLFFTFPGLGIFVSRYMDRLNPNERNAADFGLLLAAIAPFLYLAAHTSYKLYAAYKERAMFRLIGSVLEGGAPTAAMSTLTTHVIFGVSMGIFSNVLHNYSHPEGGRGMCIALLVNGPLFFHGGPRFYAWSMSAKRSWFSDAVYWILFFITPVTALAVYNLMPWGADARYAALFCGLLTPCGSIMWLVLGAIPSILRALQLPDVNPARIFPFAFSFICLFCVFPFGVFAPATVASSSYTTRSQRLDDPIDYTSFASEYSWATFLPTLLTMYGGVLAMVSVTVFAVTLNSRMDRLQEELKIVARTIKVRRRLRAIQVRAQVPVAKFVVSQMQKLPREEGVLKLMEGEWVTWRKLSGTSMDLILAEGAMLDLGSEASEDANASTEANLPEVKYTPETRLLVLERAIFQELTEVLPDTISEGMFQVLDAEEENAIREEREEELREEGRSADEVGQIADTVRIAQMTITLKLGAAIPHLFTKRLKAKCLDELCAALAEYVGVRRERVYVSQVVTHPVVGVTMILVEPPGGKAAMALNSAVAKPKRHVKTLDGFNAALARNVTLGGGADITPVRSEINVEFVRVRRVKLFDGMSIGMFGLGLHPDEEDLDRPKQYKKKSMFTSFLSGFSGGAVDLEEIIGEDAEQEEEKRQERWKRRKERKKAMLSRFAQREGRKNALTMAFVNKKKQAAPSRDEIEGVTHSAPAVVRRIVALSAFGVERKKTGSKPDPVKNKALWGGALQTLRDKEVLTFETGLSIGEVGHSSTMDHGDFFLQVLPKIYCAYSHEVEVDLEDSDDEDNIATTVPGDDNGTTRIMNMMEFRNLVGDLFPNGVSILHGMDVEWQKNRAENPTAEASHASHAPSVRSVADMAFLDAVLKGGKRVKKLNFRLFCNALPAIGAQAMPRVPFGERQQAMRMRFLRVADKQNMVSGGLGGFFKHKVKVDLTRLLDPNKPKPKPASVMARPADYESDDELPAVPEGNTEESDPADEAPKKKGVGLLKSAFVFLPKRRFEGEEDDDGDDFFDEEFDEFSDDEEEGDGNTTDATAETTDGEATDAVDDSSEEDDTSSDDGDDSGDGDDIEEDALSDSRPGTADWSSRPTTAHSHHSLFEDDPDIAMLKETREKLAQLKADEDERKKEERNFFKDRAMSIEREQDAVRVQQIQEMIASHALNKQRELGPDGAVPPPMPPEPPTGGGRPGRPRKKKGVVAPTDVSSPQTTSPELSPRGDPTGLAPPPPPAAPSGPKPPARPRRTRKQGQSGGVSFAPEPDVLKVEPPPTSPGDDSEPGPVTEQFDKNSGAVKTTEDLVKEQKAKKKAEKKARKKAEKKAAGTDGGMKKVEKSFKAVAARTAASRAAGKAVKKPVVPKKKKRKKRDKNAVRDEEWTWEHCVGEIVEAIDSVNDDADIDEVEDGTFSYTSGANIIVMGTIFAETITHTLFAFSPKLLMYWGVPPHNPAADSSEAVLLAPPQPSFTWHMVFAASFMLSLIYFIIAVPAIKLAQSGKLGMGADGKKAKTFSPQWFYAQALNVLGGALYVMLLRNMFSILICVDDLVSCSPCEEQFYMCEDATLPELGNVPYNATYMSFVNPSTGTMRGTEGWLDGYVYAPPGGVDGMVNASRAAGGCRELFNGCYDAHVVGGVCKEFTGRSHVMMAAEPRIPCWGLMHGGYLAAFLLAVTTYYPISTFLFPNFQFADISLDIKYDAGFLVVLNQAKLILAGVSSYYGKVIPGVATSNSIDRMSAYASLMIQILVFGGLCYYNYTSQPCLVKWFNIFRSISFAISFVACCSSFVMVLWWDISQRGKSIVPEEVTWGARGVGLVVLFGGWIAVALGARTVHVRKWAKHQLKKAQRAKVFKAAVQRTVIKATLAGTLHKAAGLGALQYRHEEEEEEGQTTLTDEQAVEAASKMESVADKTIALLMGAKSPLGMNGGTDSNIEEAKEGVATVTKTFRNAVMKRQMAKIAAASAFGDMASKKEGLQVDAPVVKDDESEQLLSLRERAKAAAKGKAPETEESTSSAAAAAGEGSPSSPSST